MNGADRRIPVVERRLETARAQSKFKDMPKFGTFKKGPICLQDHSDRVEFRNIKIRPLPADAGR